MDKPTKISQNQYKIMLFCMKLLTLLRAERDQDHRYPPNFHFYQKNRGGNHVTDEKHEESVTKLMMKLILGVKETGTIACFLN